MELKMAKLKFIDTRWLPFLAISLTNGTKHAVEMHIAARFQYVLASLRTHTHVPPASKCATPASHTHRANCLVFIRRLPPPALCEQGTINQGHFLRRVDVLSHRMWLKRIMGTRDSVGRGRNLHPPPTKPFMSGNLYMPTKY